MKGHLVACAIIFFAVSLRAQEVTKLIELKVADNGLYFDGAKRGNNDLDINEPGFEYFFGRRITPHGDCIKVFGDYVFMTWWSGGEEEKHVMLSRYNMKTEVLETIEFPHTHVGFRHQYEHIGDSHNTIAVGICPLDSTVHLLYDMHSYNELEYPDSFFNYNVSKVGAAAAADGSFSLDLFYTKNTYLNAQYNYSDITYPNFFLNDRDELFVWFREGGNNNGSYKFAKYDGSSWGPFTDFNVLNAKSFGNEYNWGLYGDMKYINGKLRVGFAKRMNYNNDEYVYNNGMHYAYSNDQDGKVEWYNYKEQSLTLPLSSPEKLFFFEPGSLVANGGANSITMSSGTDWTVTDRESVHFIMNNVRSSASSERVNVHAYKRAGENSFTTTTDFPGGNLYSVPGNMVFLMGLNSKRPYIYFTKGGTNNWQLLFEETKGVEFRHMNVLIEGNRLYLYLMEDASGDAQPIHLQIYDLGLPEVVLDAKPSSSKVLIYPNPVEQQLMIEGVNEIDSEYSIYNLMGRQLDQGQLIDNTIDVSALASGIYILKLIGNTGERLYRFNVK
ncbi:BNR-4 repeat-containing protein [Reichenbachiella ulvae]|uniref:BNR-4 repeat-containing protein n=1 Tax=Reichenbachiella ulvae TaxID=2980104 RepID=A0ABT3CSI0_9BACT|nr:BNR-4 repeat-containing protein [Reichenbachiella ulvae]MCV9386637.1 BNR-4 repeat-containing protein [Reichenbachiella ulvae]